MVLRYDEENKKNLHGINGDFECFDGDGWL